MENKKDFTKMNLERILFLQVNSKTNIHNLYIRGLRPPGREAPPCQDVFDPIDIQK